MRAELGYPKKNTAMYQQLQEIPKNTGFSRNQDGQGQINSDTAAKKDTERARQSL